MIFLQIILHSAVHIYGFHVFIISVLFSVVTVTPSKIKIKTIQYRKFREWEMREDKFENSIAKNQVYAIFHMRDTWNNVLHKFIPLSMEKPCWHPFEAHKFNIVA